MSLPCTMPAPLHRKRYRRMPPVGMGDTGSDTRCGRASGPHAPRSDVRLGVCPAPVEGGCRASEAGHACAVTGSLPSFWDPPPLVQNSSMAVRVDPPTNEVGERSRLNRIEAERARLFATAPLAACRIGWTLHTYTIIHAVEAVAELAGHRSHVLLCYCTLSADLEEHGL